MTSEIKTLASGFGYVEAPRWHNGSLWFSDLSRKSVIRLELDGSHRVVATVPTTPIGLGFLPDDTLIVVSSDDRLLMKVEDDGSVSTFADLTEFAVHAANDMAVDAEGRCYVSHFGYDLFGGGTPTTTGLVLVQPDGSIEMAGEDLMFPNGVAISPDGGTLVVAESFAFRLSTFDIGPGGQLSNKQTLVQFDNPETDLADGICIDAEGGVWVGCPVAGEYRRIGTDGTITDRIATDPAAPFGPACALGGANLDSLFFTTTATTLADLADGWAGAGRIDVVQVSVPAAG